MLTAERKQADHSPTTPVEGLHQLPSPDSTSVDAPGHGDAEFLA
jgi:hypothetical protein